MATLISILMLGKGKATIIGMVVTLIGDLFMALGEDAIGHPIHQIGVVLGGYGVSRKVAVNAVNKKKNKDAPIEW